MQASFLLGGGYQSQGGVARRFHQQSDMGCGNGQNPPAAGAAMTRSSSSPPVVALHKALHALYDNPVKFIPAPLLAPARLDAASKAIDAIVNTPNILLELKILTILTD